MMKKKRRKPTKPYWTDAKRVLCPVCNKRFKRRTWFQIYCSELCRIFAWYCRKAPLMSSSQKLAILDADIKFANTKKDYVKQLRQFQEKIEKQKAKS